MTRTILSRAAGRAGSKTTAAALATLLAAGLPVLSACGSGLEAQNYKPRAAPNWVDGDAGPLAVRKVYVAPPDAAGYPAGANADIVLSATTRAGSDDRLVSASSPQADSIEVPGDLVVPNDGLMLERRITMIGLAERLRSSEYVEVTLQFASGAVIDLDVPVAVTDDPPDPNPDFTVPETDSEGNPLPEGSGHGGGGHGGDEEHSDEDHSGDEHSDEDHSKDGEEVPISGLVEDETLEEPILELPSDASDPAVDELPEGGDAGVIEPAEGVSPPATLEPQPEVDPEGS